MASALRFGPLGPRAVHLCVDMQTLFAERTDWHVPWLERVLPAVTRLAEMLDGPPVPHADAARIIPIEMIIADGRTSPTPTFACAP